MVQVRTRSKSVANFARGDEGRPVVRVRPTRIDDARLEKEGFDLIQRIFTQADRTFFKPIRLTMSGAQLKNAYAQHEWVYAAIRAKATAISQVPLLVRAGDRTNPEDNSRPVDIGNEWSRFFMRPNPLLTGKQFWEAVETFIELHGEAFVVLVTKDGSEYMGDKAPHEGWLVQPSAMQHVVDKTSGELLGWKYQPPGQAAEVGYSTTEVLHLKTVNPDNPYRGLSPISPILQGVRTDFKASLFDEALLDNSGSPGGVLTSDLDLAPEQIRDVRAEWNRRHVGSRKAGHVAILGGGLKYAENKFTAKDMQFLEKREWTRDGVLAVIGTPGLAIGLDDDVNRATAQVVRRMWWTDRLIPILRFIEDVVNAHFFDVMEVSGRQRIRGQRLFVRFDVSGVEALREDFGEQLEHAKQLKELGYGMNDINARLNLGMPEVAWGEEPLAQPTQVPITVLYDTPGVFVPQGSREQELADAEGRGLEESIRQVVRVKTMPRGMARKRRFARAYVKNFHQPSEDRIHRALKGVFQRIKQKAMARAVTMANERTAAASTQKNPEAIGKLRPKDVDAILGSLKEWGEITKSGMDQPLDRVMNDALGQLGAELGGFDVVAPTDKTFTRLLARRVAAMVKVSKAVRRDMRSAILKAIEGGSVNDVRGVMTTLRDRFKQLSEGRAIRIARTETGIMGNTVRFEGMKQEGVKKHEWINAGDEFVRPQEPGDQGDHRKVDGEIVEIGEKFGNGLLYPNDPQGPAYEIINCRCVAAAVADDLE